jgi:hypothetical protein
MLTEQSFLPAPRCSAQPPTTSRQNAQLASCLSFDPAGSSSAKLLQLAFECGPEFYKATVYKSWKMYSSSCIMATPGNSMKVENRERSTLDFPEIFHETLYGVNAPL